MNYCELKLNDVANGPGVRVSLFVSGCSHRCKGCFNEESWDFDAGEEFTDETIDTIIEALKPDYVQGLTLLGGEPFERVNQQGLLPLLRRFKKEFPGKDVWCFTGYLFDKDILGRMCKEWEETHELLNMIDVLVDGEFILEQRNLMLKFKGSENQRTIDVKKSLETGEIVILF